MDDVKMIETVKERATRSGEGMRELTPEDMLSKIEGASGSETYYGGFWDYHGPSEVRPDDGRVAGDSV